MGQPQSSPLVPGTVARYLCCLALALSQACQPGEPDAPFKRYLNQLNLALGSALPAVAPNLATPMPSVGQLQLSVSASGIEGLDSLQLSGCAVQANIRKRQTNLGHFAKPSQRLLLALEYLHLVPSCIQRLRDNGEHALADRLGAATLKIQAQLPLRIFNATLGSNEYRAFWLSTSARSDYPRSETIATAAALEMVNSLAQRWLDGDYHAHNLDLELLLNTIAGGDGGQALARWSHRVDWLAAADRMVQQGLSTAVFCKTRKGLATPTRRAELARSYFVEIIQPLTTGAKMSYQDLAAPVVALENRLGLALAPRYRRWRANRNQYTAALASAPGQHLQRLGRLIHSPPACSTRDENPPR